MRKGNEFKKLPTNPAVEVIKQDIRDDERRAGILRMVARLAEVAGVVLIAVGGLKAFARLPAYRNQLYERTVGLLRDLSLSVLEMPLALSARAWPAFVELVPYPELDKIGFGQLRSMRLAEFIEAVGWLTWSIGLFLFGLALIKHSDRLRKAAQEMRSLLKAALVQLAVQGGPKTPISVEADTAIVNLRYAMEHVRETEVKSNWWVTSVVTIILGAAANIVGKFFEPIFGL